MGDKVLYVLIGLVCLVLGVGVFLWMNPFPVIGEIRVSCESEIPNKIVSIVGGVTCGQIERESGVGSKQYLGKLAKVIKVRSNVYILVSWENGGQWAWLGKSNNWENMPIYVNNGESQLEQKVDDQKLDEEKMDLIKQYEGSYAELYLSTEEGLAEMIKKTNKMVPEESGGLFSDVHPAIKYFNGCYNGGAWRFASIVVGPCKLPVLNLTVYDI